jgi:hypothetical protein
MGVLDRTRNQPEGKLALCLLKQSPAKMSMAGKRKAAALDPEFLATTLMGVSSCNCGCSFTAGQAGSRGSDLKSPRRRPRCRRHH